MISKIRYDDFTGGETSCYPAHKMPENKSRRMENCYINNKLAVAKVPGFSRISELIPDTNTESGFEFRKSDGTVKRMVATSVLASSLTEVFDGISAYNPAFTGSGINDLETNAGATAISSFIYRIEITGSTTFKWRINFSGAGASDGWSANVNITGDWQTLVGPIQVKFPTGSGYTSGDYWDFSAYGLVYEYLDDLSIVDEYGYTDTSDATFEVEIDAEGSPDTFKWRKDSGAWTTGVAITGNAQTLSDGVQIQFAATTGHQYTAKWTITATAALNNLALGIYANSLPLNDISVSGTYTDNGECRFYVKIWATGTPDQVQWAKNNGSYTNLGSASTSPTLLSDGVYIAFGATTGHAQYSLWEIKVSADGKFEINFLPYSILSGNLIKHGWTANTKPKFTYFNDKCIVSNGADRPIVYDGTTVSYITKPPFTIADAFSGTGTDDLSTTGSAYSNFDDTDYEVEILKSSASPVVDSSATLNDLTADGSGYTGTTSTYFEVVIDLPSTPDSFKWRKDGGSWTTGIHITGSPQLLSDGVYITFGATTGHSYDFWQIYVVDVFRWKKESGSYKYQIIDGTAQTLTDGIKVTFTDKVGHTIGDKWNLTINSPIFQWTHVHKNRLWASCSDDKMISYHSALRDHNDYQTADDAGYIDFKYVLAQGDELLEIATFIDYIVYCFKNHFAIYAGDNPTASGDFILTQLIKDIGLMAPFTTVQLQTDLIFLTNKGIKSMRHVITAGSMEIGSISDDINPELIQNIKENNNGYWHVLHYIRQGWLMFLIDNTIWIYMYKYNAWARIIIPASLGIRCLFNDLDGDVYLGGADYIYYYGLGYDFGGEDIPFVWKTAYFYTKLFIPFELVISMLSWQWTDPSQINLSVRHFGYEVDYEDQTAFNYHTFEVPAKAAISVTDVNKIRQPISGIGKYVSFEFSCENSYGPIEFGALELKGQVLRK